MNLDVVITKEKIDGKIYFVVQGIQLDVASQGLSLDEALENIKDAAEIVLESSGEPSVIVQDEQFTPVITRVTI